MNTSRSKIVFATNKGRAGFLFLLAILMLVVSCPFKRLLQAESNNRIAAQQSQKWNGFERQHAAYKTSSCCVQKQKITLAKTEVGRQKLQAPDFLPAQNLQTGFALHYFLSGTEKLYSNVVPTSLSSLPLFLQQRRLLI